MEPHVGALTGIAVIISVAVVGGLALSVLRQPAVVGYIVAGVVLGPSGLGVIADASGVSLLAELGVLLLLFLIGMELSLRAFVDVVRTALLCTTIQVAVGVAIGFGLAIPLGRSTEQAVLFGFMVALSSTAVAVKMLEHVGELKTAVGRVAVGVLIAQDLAAVMMLIVITALGETGDIRPLLALKVGFAVVLVAALMLVFSGRRRVTLPATAWLRRQPDLLPLAALAFCFTAAAVSGLIGLSAPYGAFIAGLIVGNSSERDAAVAASRPFENVLMVMFFLGIGLLIDLRLIVDHPGEVLSWLVAVTVVKTAVNVAALHAIGEPWERAFPAGVALGQIGEFSFILAAAGLAGGILDQSSYKLAIAVIALSLLVSPLWLGAARRAHDVAAQHFERLDALLERAFVSELAALRAGRDRVGAWIRRRRGPG